MLTTRAIHILKRLVSDVILPVPNIYKSKVLKRCVNPVKRKVYHPDF